MHVNLFEALVDTTITPRYETKAKLKTASGRDADSTGGDRESHQGTVWY